MKERKAHITSAVLGYGLRHLNQALEKQGSDLRGSLSFKSENKKRTYTLTFRGRLPMTWEGTSHEIWGVLSALTWYINTQGAAAEEENS